MHVGPNDEETAEEAEAVPCDTLVAVQYLAAQFPRDKFMNKCVVGLSVYACACACAYACVRVCVYVCMCAEGRSSLDFSSCGYRLPCAGPTVTHRCGDVGVLPAPRLWLRLCLHAARMSNVKLNPVIISRTQDPWGGDAAPALHGH